MNKYYIAQHRSYISDTPHLAFGGGTFSKQNALELASDMNRSEIGRYCVYFVVPAPFAGKM